MYGTGQGVPQDYIIAYMWFNLAAANGDEKALKNRGIVAERMSQTDISKAQEMSRACFAQDYKNCGY
jgi:TPR repeat protein